MATLGPATDTFDTIEALFLNGADVFRLNFSHGTHEEKAEFVRIIREIEKKWNHPIAILADLQVSNGHTNSDHEHVYLWRVGLCVETGP